MVSRAVMIGWGVSLKGWPRYYSWCQEGRNLVPVAGAATVDPYVKLYLSKVPYVLILIYSSAHTFIYKYVYMNNVYYTNIFVWSWWSHALHWPGWQRHQDNETKDETPKVHGRSSVRRAPDRVSPCRHRVWWPHATSGAVSTVFLLILASLFFPALAFVPLLYDNQRFSLYFSYTMSLKKNLNLIEYFPWPGLTRFVLLDHGVGQRWTPCQQWMYSGFVPEPLSFMKYAITSSSLLCIPSQVLAACRSRSPTSVRRVMRALWTGKHARGS